MKALIILLKIPFVFLPGIALWLLGCVGAFFLCLILSSPTDIQNPFPSLRKTCRWLSGAYVRSGRYVASCFT